MYSRKNRVLIVSAMLATAIGVGVIIGAFAGHISNKIERLPASSNVTSLPSSALSSISEPASSAVSSEESSAVPVSSQPPVSSAPVSSAPASSAPAVSSSQPQQPAVDLTTLFPEMYVEPTEKIAHQKGDKVVYLTFDDGPSALTPEVLKVLADNDIKATFFVVGRSDAKSKAIMKDIVDQGHTIGMHTYTHEYHQIYASPSAFLEDMARLRSLIVDATGTEPALIRFAGGSVNSYNKPIARTLANEMTRRGYTYHDWNVNPGDAERGATRSTIYQRAVSQSKQFEKAVVLFHDAGNKHDTLAELPKVIQELKRSGYRFDKLDASVNPMTFKLPPE